MPMEVRRQILPFVAQPGWLPVGGGGRSVWGAPHAAENAHADHLGLSLRTLTQARQSCNHARIA